MRQMKKHNGGFTLTELLVVIAILAILVGVAIPVFTAATEDAREAVCAANRRSLFAILTSTYIADEDTAAVKTAFDANIGSFKCPDGGVISYTLDAETGLVTMACTVHTAGMGNSIGTIVNAFTAAAKGGGRIDSGAVGLDGSNASAAVADLASHGLALNELGAVSWHYEKRNSAAGGYSVLQWTTADINDGSYAKGDPIYIIQYRSDSGNYTVWKARVSEDSYSSTAYKTIGPISGTVLNATQTYDGALAAYKEAVS